MLARLAQLCTVWAGLADSLRQHHIPQNETSTRPYDASSAAFHAMVADSASKRAMPKVRGGNPLVILTFVNNEYRASLVNWMARMRKLGVDNYEVVCMDNETAAFMESIGRPCSRAAQVGMGKKKVWEFRLHVLMDLLHEGTDVVLCDVDAIWLNNPFGFLEKGDIVASQAYMPFDVSKRLGATACLGWTFFRAAPAVARFVSEDVMDYFRIDQDDQIAVNHALLKNGLRFSPSVFNLSSSEIAEGRAGPLAVRFLDTERFKRSCGKRRSDLDRQRLYVAHCAPHLPQGWTHEAVDRDEHLKHLGLWFLRIGWEDVPAINNFNTWIDRVSVEANPE